MKRTNRVTKDRLGSLRHVIAAGEVLPADVIRYWMKALPEVQFTNMYGPTEITVDCTFQILHYVPSDAGVPIGVSRRNMEVFVRTEDGKLSKEPGAEGEIAVRGTSVSYGYLNNEEKTAAAFMQNPNHDLYHDPIYLTGDYARIGDGRCFYYIGRIDEQIKHMGNRIELGEIESALRKITGVVDAAVVYNDSVDLEDKFIGALLVLEGKTVGDISIELESKLPAYMLPKRLQSVPELPLTPNGKTDRKRALKTILENWH